MIRRAGGAVIAVVLLVAACTGSMPDTPVGEGQGAVSDVVSDVERFAREHGLDGLPRTTARIERMARPDRTDPGGAERAAPLDFSVLVADTPVTRGRGLQGVNRLPDSVGMLFLFPEPPGPDGRPGFWMLETLLLLDIAFVQDGTVVGVATMTPCEARPCPITHPGVEFDMALEVAAGGLVDAGVVPGDRLTVGP